MKKHTKKGRRGKREAEMHRGEHHASVTRRRGVADPILRRGGASGDVFSVGRERGQRKGFVRLGDPERKGPLLIPGIRDLFLEV